MSSAQASDNEMTEDGIFNAIISNNFSPPNSSRLLLCAVAGKSQVPCMLEFLHYVFLRKVKKRCIRRLVGMKEWNKMPCTFLAETEMKLPLLRIFSAATK